MTGRIFGFRCSFGELGAFLVEIFGISALLGDFREEKKFENFRFFRPRVLPEAGWERVWSGWLLQGHQAVENSILPFWDLPTFSETEIL